MVEQFIREGADPVIVAGVAFTPGHFDEQAVCPRVGWSGEHTETKHTGGRFPLADAAAGERNAGTRRSLPGS